MFSIPTLTPTVKLLIGVVLIVFLNWTKCSFALLEKPRILGGTPAKPGQFPWIISLQRWAPNATEESNMWQHICGGAILNEDTIVTAAHCTWNTSMNNLKIVAGAFNIKMEEETQQHRNVSGIIRHPSYSAGYDPGAYDVSLITLEEDLDFNEIVGPIRPSNEGETPEGVCDNAGWGNLFPVTKVYKKGSDVLITSKTTVVEKQRCEAAYPMLVEELKTAMCADPGLFYGNCQGDSGGPLVCYKNEKPFLAGIVSFGFLVCNDGIHPDVYTDVANTEIQKFINKNVNGTVERNNDSENTSEKKKSKKKAKGKLPLDGTASRSAGGGEDGLNLAGVQSLLGR